MCIFESYQSKFSYFLFALAVWVSIFYFVNEKLHFRSKFSKKQSDDMKNRIVATIHGLFAFMVSGYHLANDDPHFLQRSTDIQHFILLTSGAYFLYDWVACYWYGLLDIKLNIHHAMCLFGVIVCEYTDNATTSLSNFWFLN